MENTQYDVVKSDGLSSLIKEVNKKINEGWDLIGGICASGGSIERVYCQAIVKYPPQETVSN